MASIAPVAPGWLTSLRRTQPGWRACGRRWPVLAMSSMLLAVTTLAACGSPSRSGLVEPPGMTSSTHPVLSTTTTMAVSTTAAARSTTTAGRSMTTIPTAAPSRTQVDTFAPFTFSGTVSPDVRVARTVVGTCFATSIAVAVQGTYRCMSGNYIYDPCFASGSGSQTELACAETPWAGVTLMEVSGPLPIDVPEPGNPISSPWVIQLANGERYVVSTGANAAVGGVNLPYYCSPSNTETSTVSETSEPWTVQYLPSSTSSVLTSVVVVVAWD